MEHQDSRVGQPANVAGQTPRLDRALEGIARGYRTPSFHERSFPLYGWVGLLMLLLMEVALVVKQMAPPGTWMALLGVRLTQWTTPVCWWGYILAIDALIWKLQGHSLLCDRRHELWRQLPLSVAFWLIFEVYNLHLQNWTYIGLPERRWETALSAMIAYATIMPGLFLTAELLGTLGIFARFRVPTFEPSRRLLYLLIFFGFICLMAPLLLPRQVARYLFALVWIGFILLCEPVLYASRGDSVLRDLAEGQLQRVLSLVTAGYICGLLWEFWNYWATAKWIYTVPFTEDVRYFEMPLAGFLGFGPFAWEFAAMYATVRLLGRQATAARATDAPI
jgi:hypothetical protein